MILSTLSWNTMLPVLLCESRMFSDVIYIVYMYGMYVRYTPSHQCECHMNGYSMYVHMYVKRMTQLLDAHTWRGGPPAIATNKFSDTNLVFRLPSSSFFVSRT